MRFTSFISYIVSFLLIYASMLIAEGSHFNLLNYWDPASLVVILGGISISLVNFKISEISNALKDAVSALPSVGFRERFELDKLVLRNMGNYIVFAAIIFFIFDFIIILGNFESATAFSTAFAVALIGIIYAIALKFLLFSPLMVSLEKKYLLLNEQKQV